MMPLMPFEVVPGSGPAVVPYPVPGQPPAAVRTRNILNGSGRQTRKWLPLIVASTNFSAKWKVAKSDSEREEIQKELRASLKGEFNARFVRHRREIEELETKVRELRRQLDLRDDKQDEIVDFRLQQLLRDAQGLGWGTESVTQPSSGGLTRPGVTRSASAYTTSPAYAVPTSPAAKTEYPRPQADLAGQRHVPIHCRGHVDIRARTGHAASRGETSNLGDRPRQDHHHEIRRHDNNPIIGKRDGIKFTASVDEPPDKTSLKGTLTGDNELSGELTTVAKDGQVVIAKGTFKLIKLPAQIKLLESIGESTSVQPAQSQHEAQRIDVIRLARIDPQTAVLSINKLFSSGDPKQATTSGPQVDADPASKQLMIRGTDAQIVQIPRITGKIGRRPAARRREQRR